jgi:hypothetical protein
LYDDSSTEVENIQVTLYVGFGLPCMDLMIRSIAMAPKSKISEIESQTKNKTKSDALKKQKAVAKGSKKKVSGNKAQAPVTKAKTTGKKVAEKVQSPVTETTEALKHKVVVPKKATVAKAPKLTKKENKPKRVKGETEPVPEGKVHKKKVGIGKSTKKINAKHKTPKQVKKVQRKKTVKVAISESVLKSQALFEQFEERRHAKKVRLRKLQRLARKITRHHMKHRKYHANRKKRVA